jgi:hypothetical protein
LHLGERARGGSEKPRLCHDEGTEGELICCCCCCCCCCCSCRSFCRIICV